MPLLGETLLAAPDLKCNLNLWDGFPAGAVMSPAAVCTRAGMRRSRSGADQAWRRNHGEERAWLGRLQVLLPAPSQDVGQRGARLGLRWRGYLKTI